MVARVSDSDEEEFDNNQLAVHKASSRHPNKLTIILQVEEIALEMEVDTGAELSTIFISKSCMTSSNILPLFAYTSTMALPSQ